jgi:hypothetical protein
MNEDLLHHPAEKVLLLWVRSLRAGCLVAGVMGFWLLVSILRGGKM